MAEFKELYNEMRAAGVTTRWSDRIANRHIRSAINHIALKTNIMRVWVPIDYHEGVIEYPIAKHIEDCFMPLRLLTARVGGKEVDMGDARDEVDALMDDDGSYVEIHHIPRYSCNLNSDSDQPYQGVGLEVSVTLSPSACTMPDVMYNRYWTVIVEGATAKMLMMSGMPWTNIALGKELWGEFTTQLRGIRTDMASGRTARVKRVSRKASRGMLARRGSVGFR